MSWRPSSGPGNPAPAHASPSSSERLRAVMQAAASSSGPTCTRSKYVPRLAVASPALRRLQLSPRLLLLVLLLPGCRCQPLPRWWPHVKLYMKGEPQVSGFKLWPEMAAGSLLDEAETRMLPDCSKRLLAPNNDNFYSAAVKPRLVGLRQSNSTTDSLAADQNPQRVSSLPLFPPTAGPTHNDAPTPH